MAANQDTLYIKGDRNVEVTKTDVTLGDILSMECSNKTVLPKLKTMKIIKLQEGKHQRVVISVLKIIACIHAEYPGIEVQSLGEQDMIITYENQKTPPKWLHILKAAAVVLITFFGAAFSIMAFNNDVDVTKLFEQFYTFVTGNESEGFSVLEISYSIGITIGILIFFNHFGKRRFTVDPTPMEVQMRTYENEIQTTLVEAASRKGEELDVGKSNHTAGASGSRRS